MNGYVFVDSNVFIQLLYEGARASEAEDLLEKHPLLATSIGVVDEVLHFIIRREAMNKYGVKRAYDLRRLIRDKGVAFAKESLAKFSSLLEELYVRVVTDAETQPSQIISTMDKYRLSPRDAIIALTCKHYGIDTILTFDEDFKRVPWLRATP
ncbi:type II toxin-antitoxin system VapC family toxin [Pyrofollis japonicus]|uniref:PIN domain-containing protein n=1 Tax=Pyrofollis japonicus TaxID=3060460 RepID=UPI00295AFA45|nr:PIN domain-containing protein [Pyrofollis japonicus]BEP17359.1 type II toxin-antitoxin system VapC family toxin [Pyrofollis japonicus]